MNDEDSFSESGWPNDVSMAVDDAQWTDMTLVSVDGGGMMAVYRARRHGKWHVLKALKPAYRGNPVAQAMIKKEFDIAFSLSHPSIAAIIGFECIKDLGDCIVEEWVDGSTLRDIMSRGQLDAATALNILSQLIDALDYLHERGVVHRDLKPSNIMITAIGKRVKIIDFGVSDTASHATLKGPAGTRRYAAPEVLEGDAADERADIYSLGVIADEMNQALPKRNRRIARLAEACMRHDPDQRPQRHVEVKAVFNSKTYGKTFWTVAAIAAFVAVVAIVAWRLMGSDSTQGHDESHAEMASDTLVSTLPVSTDTVPTDAPPAVSASTGDVSPPSSTSASSTPVALPADIDQKLCELARQKARELVDDNDGKLAEINNIRAAMSQIMECKWFIDRIEREVVANLRDTYRGDQERHDALQAYFETEKGVQALHEAATQARALARTIAAEKYPDLAPHFNDMKR